MIYLFLSILASSLINVIFRLFNRYEIDNELAITINYITCVVTGLLVSGHNLQLATCNLSDTWVWMSLSMGILFILVFNGMAITARKDGISVAVVASKMGVVFPIVFAAIYLGDSLTPLLILGIVLSLASVFLTSRKSGKKGVWVMTVIPILVFVGSGTIDTLLKIIEINTPTQIDGVMPVILIFFSSAFFGLILWLFQLKAGNSSWHIKHLIAGVVLGVPNYFSIYFLFMALGSKGLQTAQIFPINNMGVVLLSSLLSIVLFREKLSKTNYLGLLLALVSILLISQKIVE